MQWLLQAAGSVAKPAMLILKHYKPQAKRLKADLDRSNVIVSDSHSALAYLFCMLSGGGGVSRSVYDSTRRVQSFVCCGCLGCRGRHKRVTSKTVTSYTCLAKGLTRTKGQRASEAVLCVIPRGKFLVAGKPGRNQAQFS